MLGLWERDIFFTLPVRHIERVLFWTRYIDDTLVIWQGPEEEPKEFSDILNINNKNIKLTPKFSQQEVEFLDIRIFKDSRGMLHMDKCWNTTSVNSLLHDTYGHPEPTKKAIPVGQFLRAKRICSQDS